MTHARQQPTDRPIQVIAHRGASDDAPEHTLAAYRKAIEDGADALECDVRLTADGHLVCVHDRRVNRTSNGRGAVSALELAELAALDFGSWKDREESESPDWDPVPGELTSVLTLERLLELVVETRAAGRPLQLAVETKHPTRWAGQVEERLLQLLKHFELDAPSADEPSPVRIMSFSARSLHRIQVAAPMLPTVYLMQFVSPRLRDGRLPAGARIAGPGMRIVRNHPGYIERLHRAGHRVHVWTVNEPEDVERCVDLGIEAIITNRPKQVLAQLGRS
ncbi:MULTISPECIES: glycerophosphodiester phosphodiesterase [unclassified Streptomyces]|uniref:glycerophosphodiester phosphodiesterase n=1 Tax=unclassified Streptomyces TaxID=2593676 RepID=UPI000F5BA359|nr:MULTISPECIES: glycerophosphodiester phosphodiesterase [unclassified Streptomyces]WSG52141.1 glycerophosphodiester phosphodiesterase [Streptomyces sp. NBC_01732]WSX02755.1 glycerophosphodiester phosphodiesterase [Streptomyces sp. NBC_00987]MCX4395333.1 glycerophosphodiester phosphodiesterase [Streptomyces sp. NBC_01767]MCX5161578.1 glycerophosphodiester phosphodiesterase [Streptomyces sp. NBC_00305]MCX5220101.1 glycerophosphodiester phosphodiesterase [Streptomyces sp. NBC_00264]